MTTRRILVIADLEGITGVDDVASLSALAPGFARARELYTEEVEAVAAALLAAGYAEVRIVDSHRAGLRGPNLLADRLPAGASVSVNDDSYAPAFFRDIDAVACVGMHAAAGSRGFAAHTVDLHCAWESQDIALSESHLVAALAAEAGVPVLFASGDDVLGAHLAGSVPFVETKRARDAFTASSHALEETRRRLVAAATGSPVEVARRGGRVSIRCKRAWQTERCVIAGGRRIDAYTVELEGNSFRDVYERGMRMIADAGRPLRRALLHGKKEDTVAAVSGCLTAPFAGASPPPRPEAAARALQAFLARTEGDASWQRADRALAIRAIRGIAPRWFRERALEPVLDDALVRLRQVPAVTADLAPAELMARIDAIYLARLHRLPHIAPVPADLRAALAAVVRRSPGLGWLVSELAAAAGLAPPPAIGPRALRDRAWVDDLYCATHVVLLATRYCELPYSRVDPGLMEELALAVPRLVREERVDLAAEVALCLQLGGEAAAIETHDALALVARHQADDGTVLDPTAARASGDEADRLAAHATGAALLAWVAAPGFPG